MVKKQPEIRESFRVKPAGSSPHTVAMVAVVFFENVIDAVICELCRQGAAIDGDKLKLVFVARIETQTAKLHQIRAVFFDHSYRRIRAPKIKSFFVRHDPLARKFIRHIEKERRIIRIRRKRLPDRYDSESVKIVKFYEIVKAFRFQNVSESRRIDVEIAAPIHHRRVHPVNDAENIRVFHPERDRAVAAH